ncbi:MAG TPA: hypothetical protein VFC42_16180 [Methylomirabilota bacterium]|nr:hypothetical protein [Methylomirabilota bacterium]
MTAPPADRLARAAALLAEGDWRGAHALVQDDPSEAAAWLHGIAHTLEGDLANARHWYRRAHRPFPGPDAVAHEIALARRSLDPAAPPVP